MDEEEGAAEEWWHPYLSFCCIAQSLHCCSLLPRYNTSKSTRSPFTNPSRATITLQPPPFIRCQGDRLLWRIFRFSALNQDDLFTLRRYLLTAGNPSTQLWNKETQPFRIKNVYFIFSGHFCVLSLTKYLKIDGPPFTILIFITQIIYFCFRF